MEGSGASVSIPEHRKLSLGSGGNKGDSHKEIYNVDYAQKHNESRPLKEANIDLSKHTGNFGILQATRNKLSLKVSVSSHSRNAESEKENLSTISSVDDKELRNDVICDKNQQINEVYGSDKMKQVVEVEAVIVLDSEEESENEAVPVRSKLSLAKRCFSRKRKMASDR